jgi:hypothetical protein
MSFSTIDIKEENFWGGVEPQTPPPVIRAQLKVPNAPSRDIKARDPLKPLDTNALDELLVAWSVRSHQNRMAVLNAEADNLLTDILGNGRKERVLDALTDTIATAKRRTDLKVFLWSYKTVEYGRDIEGTSWADKPYDGFTTSRDWARCYDYETYITASRYSVDYIFKHTDAMKRLVEAFSDKYFKVTKRKTVDYADGEVTCYTVNLWLEFWPSKTAEVRHYESVMDSLNPYKAAAELKEEEAYYEFPYYDVCIGEDGWGGDCACCDDEY